MGVSVSTECISFETIPSSMLRLCFSEDFESESVREKISPHMKSYLQHEAVSFLYVLDIYFNVDVIIVQS